MVRKGVLWIVVVSMVVLGMVQAGQAENRRRYYLTATLFDGSHALQACFFGFHMASLWELFNMTTLDYGFPGLDVRQADSGFGPPTSVPGWVRTGSNANGTIGAPGFDNCFAWTSNSVGNNGTQVLLHGAWTTSPGAVVNPWFPGIASCITPLSVWCVENRFPLP